MHSEKTNEWKIEHTKFSFSLQVDKITLALQVLDFGTVVQYHGRIDTYL